jgi:hypothetical protein
MMEQIDEGEILKILSEEDTAANFYRNKDAILSTIYQLSKDKSILIK